MDGGRFDRAALYCCPVPSLEPMPPLHGALVITPAVQSSSERPGADRRRVSLIFALASVALLALAIGGAISEAAGYLLVDAVTGHRLALVLGALVAGLAAAIARPVRRGGPGFARGLLVAGLVVGLLAGTAWAALMSGLAESDYASPDGRYVLVVSEGVAMIDPLWDVSLQESSWVVARTVPLACFNGDAPGNALASVAWVDDTTIEAVTDSGAVHRISINDWPSSPMPFVSVGCDGLIGIP